MANTCVNDRVEALIASMTDALESQAKQMDFDPRELVLASINLAVRMCLACAEDGQARSMMTSICDDYFAQVERNFEAVQ